MTDLVPQPWVVTSSELEPLTQVAVRSLMDLAFEGDYSDDDWDHGLGGWHVLAGPPEAPVAHASVVERTIHVGAQTWRTGYVESVATAPEHHRRGHGSAVMLRINELIEEHFDLGMLATGVPRFYHRLGWTLWLGPTSVRHGETTVRSPDADGAIMALRVGPSRELDVRLAISCEARPGDDW